MGWMATLCHLMAAIATSLKRPTSLHSAAAASCVWAIKWDGSGRGVQNHGKPGYSHSRATGNVRVPWNSAAQCSDDQTDPNWNQNINPAFITVNCPRVVHTSTCTNEPSRTLTCDRFSLINAPISITDGGAAVWSPLG